MITTGWGGLFHSIQKYFNLKIIIIPLQKEELYTPPYLLIFLLIALLKPYLPFKLFPLTSLAPCFRLNFDCFLIVD